MGKNRRRDRAAKSLLLNELETGIDSLLTLPRDGLYAITPEHLQGAALLRSVEAVLRGGAVMLQYRAKRDSSALREDAAALLALCARFQVPLVINDHLELAAALACGVHLGEQDASITEARARLGPRAIVGASCYDSVVLAQRASDAGASYLAFGSFYPSSTKDQPRRAEEKHLRKARYFGLPLVAIGGLTVERGPALLSAGANYLAVVSALFDAPDPQLQAERFSGLWSQPGTKLH